MRKKIIIGISGKAQSGKSTLALMLNDIFLEREICPFAQELKKKAVEEFNITPYDITHKKNKIIKFGKNKMTIRKLLIDIGQMYRNIDIDFWTRQVLTKIKKSKNNVFIIDDLRFKNEAKALLKEGAILIRIQRDKEEKIDDISEKDLDNFKFKIRIKNNGNFNDLRAEAINIIHKLMKT